MTTTTATIAATTADVATLELTTAAGPVLARVYGSPQGVYLDRNRWTFEPAHPPYIAARLVSPEAPDGLTTAGAVITRGYLDGRRAYRPLVVNGVPYSVDALAFRLPDGTWTTDPRALPPYVAGASYWPRLSRLAPTVDGLAVVTFDDTEPTAAARRRLGELLPEIAAALGGPEGIAAAAEARDAAIAALARHADRLRAELTEAAEAVTVRADEARRQFAELL